MYKITKDDKQWAAEVKKRDNNCCVICGSSFKVNAHHLIVREIHETKFDIDNGLTLCPKHHIFDRKISAHNNPLGLFTWMAIHKTEQLRGIMGKMKKILENGD